MIRHRPDFHLNQFVTTAIPLFLPFPPDIQSPLPRPPSVSTLRPILTPHWLSRSNCPIRVESHSIKRCRNIILKTPPWKQDISQHRNGTGDNSFMAPYRRNHPRSRLPERRR